MNKELQLGINGTIGALLNIHRAKNNADYLVTLKNFILNDKKSFMDALSEHDSDDRVVMLTISAKYDHFMTLIDDTSIDHAKKMAEIDARMKSFIEYLAIKSEL